MFYFLMGIIVGVGGALIFTQIHTSGEDSLLTPRSQSGKEDIIEEGEQGKAENLTRLRVYLEGKDQITNAEVEELLDVSDATATRYLDTLEDEGLVEQKDAGRSTYYEIR